MSSSSYIVLSGSHSPRIHEPVHVKKIAQFLTSIRKKMSINTSSFTGAMIDITSYDSVIFHEENFELNSLKKLFLEDLTMGGITDTKFYIVNNLNGLISYFDDKEYTPPYTRVVVSQIILGNQFVAEIRQLIEKQNLDIWFNGELRIALGPNAYIYSYFEDDLSRTEYHKAFKKLFPDINTTPLNGTASFFGDMSVSLVFGRLLIDNEIEAFINGFKSTNTYRLLREAISHVFLSQEEALKISLATEVVSA